MKAKTSQLQIRISPSQKAALKALAEDAGLSVSEYVLDKALPSDRLHFEEKVQALAEGPDRDGALEELCAYLAGLSDEGFRRTVTGGEPAQLAPVPLSYAAAAVEREAARRSIPPPSWTRTLRPLDVPHFAWELRSLRPHLMRLAAPAFKRRRLFVPAVAGPESVRALPSRPADTGDAASGGGSPGSGELLSRYDHALAGRGVVVELCVVGGAVLRLAFTAEPVTRRPRAVLADPELALDARRRAAEKGGVAMDRLQAAARELVGRHGGPGGAFEGRALRVFRAPADYVLAMRCLALAFAPETGTEDDIRYLLRFMGVHRIDEAMALVDRYLNPRQRPADLEIRLERLLG